jgi:hypothetical protein
VDDVVRSPAICDKWVLAERTVGGKVSTISATYSTRLPQKRDGGVETMRRDDD